MASSPIVLYPRGKKAIRIIAIVVTVLVVAGLLYYPVALAISASWIALYTNLPTGSGTIDPQAPVNFPLVNNAPVRVPGFTPQYLMTVAILSGSTTCLLDTYDGFYPCSSSTYVSVGSILPGQTGSAVVYLVPDGKSFTIKADGFLQFLSFKQHVASLTYECSPTVQGQPAGNTNYQYSYQCEQMH